MNAVDNLKIDNVSSSSLILPQIDNELSLNFKEKHFDKIKKKIYDDSHKKTTEITKNSIKVPNLRKY